MSSIVYVMEPPQGQVRTEVNPPSSAGSVLAAGVATSIIAIIGVCLRLFTRKYVVKGVLGIDDYLCICALVVSMGFLGCSLHIVSLGAGHHMWDVPLENYSPHLLQTNMAMFLTFAISIAFAKLSILSFYLRICPDRFFRRIVYSIIAVVCTYTVTFMLLIIFRCRPVSRSWETDIDGHCVGRMIPMMTLSIFNIVLDVVVLLLPIKVVLPLQIPIRQKISLGLLFATGGFICVVAIKRTIIMAPLLRSADYTWKLPSQILWSFIEVNGGLFCACVPALKPLFVRYIPLFANSHGHSSTEKFHSEKAKRGRTIYTPSYELPSREELSESARNDDEAQLWSDKKGAMPSSVDTRQDSESVESFSDKLPRKPAPVGFSTKQVQDINGIHITKETFITIS